MTKAHIQMNTKEQRIQTIVDAIKARKEAYKAVIKYEEAKDLYNDFFITNHYLTYTEKEELKIKVTV